MAVCRGGGQQQRGQEAECQLPAGPRQPPGAGAGGPGPGPGGGPPPAAPPPGQQPRPTHQVRSSLLNVGIVGAAVQAQHLPGGGGPPLPHLQLPLPDVHSLAADIGVDSRTTSVQLSIIFYYSVFVSSKRDPNFRGFNEMVPVNYPV